MITLNWITALMMRYYLWTIGCQMNQADSWRVAQKLTERGYTAVAQPATADVIILNSCVVRASAEQRVWGRLSALKPLHSSRHRAVPPLIKLMGCAVGDNVSTLRTKFPYVDAFFAPSDVAGVLQFITANERRLQAQVVPAASPSSSPSPPALPAPVAAYLPIIYGCDNFCAYCIVPYRRGRERSRPKVQIVAEARELVARGAREITLLGQNVNS